jgi:hypothetical protein
MALDLVIRVNERESGTLTEMFTSLDLTAEELGYVHMLQDAIQFRKEIILVDLDV